MVNNSWKSVTLSQIGTFQKGSGISRAESNSGVLPAVRYGELYTVHNNYVRTYTSHISREVANKALRVHYGDVLFACSGETKEDIAKCAAIIDNSEVYAGGDIIVLSPTTEVDPIFLGFILNTPNVIQQRAQKAQGDAIVHISADSIKSIEITVPEYAEQVKIAKVLYDIDTLIVNLEKLIAKKKAIKQGAMQELLTGKRRLPGFDGEWINRTIKESCSRVGVGLATSVTQYYRTSGTVIFRNLNIKPNYLDDSDILYLDTDFAMSNPSKIIRTGDVLTVHTGYVGISCVVPPKYDGALTFTTLISTTKSDVLVPEYLAYHLNSDLGHAEIENLQAGGGRNNLNVADFVQYSMVLPVDINEQKAIVSILIDMDREISEYESKLEKYNHIKQGMMSELLTGHIRLIDKEDA